MVAEAGSVGQGAEEAVDGEAGDAAQGGGPLGREVGEASDALGDGLGEAGGGLAGRGDGGEAWRLVCA